MYRYHNISYISSLDSLKSILHVSLQELLWYKVFNRSLYNMINFQRKWKLQLKRLSDEFMVICNEFHNTQKIIREKKKNQITSGSDTEGQYSEPRLEHENDVEDEQIRLQEWELKLHFVEEQEQEVQKLQEDILVINQLMREISSLINEQSENVDNIEANVEETTIRVIEGTEQLQQAAIHKHWIYLIASTVTARKSVKGLL
ncbi:syntaxin-12-like [Schistocerca serialis cubense]|uniref:syntaxin-12-like n=1 Tax=Schistocerca serialis cubense TaxID=2023355 RepID=UPI00214E8287|nr:syntaxin-12-like [Schistocerca serialis cubense]